MLINVGRDANDQYLPIAFEVGENETRDFWSWFIKLLLDDISCDRLRTLKTRDITGPERHADDPFVIPEEDISVGSAKGKKTWNDIQKSLT